MRRQLSRINGNLDSFQGSLCSSFHSCISGSFDSFQGSIDSDFDSSIQSSIDGGIDSDNEEQRRAEYLHGVPGSRSCYLHQRFH